MVARSLITDTSTKNADHVEASSDSNTACPVADEIPRPGANVSSGGTRIILALEGQDVQTLRGGTSLYKDKWGDGSDSGQSRKRRRLPRENQENQAKFACPYFKRDPRKYMTWRTCFGPGWESVHRVKEHLYRKHRLPGYQCATCKTRFPELVALKAHSQCAWREHEEILFEGLDKHKEDQLRSRKKSSSQETDEEAKWYEIWDTLFPDDPPDRVRPSPYYEEPANMSTSGCSTDLAAYLGFWESEKQRLKDDIAKTLSQGQNLALAVASKQTDQIFEVLQRYHDKVLGCIHASDSEAAAAGLPWNSTFSDKEVGSGLTSTLSLHLEESSMLNFSDESLFTLMPSPGPDNMASSKDAAEAAHSTPVATVTAGSWVADDICDDSETRFYENLIQNDTSGDTLYAGFWTEDFSCPAKQPCIK